MELKPEAIRAFYNGNRTVTAIITTRIHLRFTRFALHMLVMPYWSASVLFLHIKKFNIDYLPYSNLKSAVPYTYP